ncbi:hypothetical protein ACQEU5_03150 [Marinactinospora thermotolerans]|uniref:Thioredoxin domain-containing protein n=1 Tax=Marinactinospora thermotolerans DSM 45154 TaxID=1122192 RepID=A0A1T4LHH8_9ACTN|nr:hypothetical protein [Marinactinospora thermotolerans]SJZ54163.1 hypothetical protein SAMN02745673_00679 [Marinactinospora thermotolerans DSM 45154]
MTLSFPAALAAAAMLVAVFAVAVSTAVYIRLRQLSAIVFAGQRARPPRYPVRLRPGPGDGAALVALLDGTCPLCREVWEAVAAACEEGRSANVRIVFVFADAEAAGRYPDASFAETMAGADLWSEVYEGYTPVLALVDHEGALLDRRYVRPGAPPPETVATLLTRAHRLSTALSKE